MNFRAAALHRPVRVLVADDDDLFAYALQLELAGYRSIEVVARARNGKEAVTLARELRPNVVLMDVEMPVLDGIEATQRITSELHGVRVVVLTGSAAPTTAASSRAAGAHRHLTKGCSTNELLRAIDAASGRWPFTAAA